MEIDIPTMLQNAPAPIAALAIFYILGKTALAIIKMIVEARAEKVRADIRIAEAESQSRQKAAEFESQAKIKTAELGLEKEKAVLEAQRLQNERESKQASELDVYRTERTQSGQATATAFQIAATVQAETVRQLASLSRVQKTINASIEGAEKRLGAKVEGARDDIVGGIEEYRDFSFLYWGMLTEDPRASRERLKRAKQAFEEGDMEKVQDIADEDVPSPTGGELLPVPETIAGVTLQ